MEKITMEKKRKRKEDSGDKPLRSRQLNFSMQDEEFLVGLALKKKKIIENKKTDSVTDKQKIEAWKEIAKEFNAANSSLQCRTVDSLRNKCSKIKLNLRKRASQQKQYAKITGGGPSCSSPPPLSDIMLQLEEVIALSAHGMPPQSYDEDFIVTDNAMEMNECEETQLLEEFLDSNDDESISNLNRAEIDISNDGCSSQCVRTSVIVSPQPTTSTNIASTSATNVENQTTSNEVDNVVNLFSSAKMNPPALKSVRHRALVRKAPAANIDQVSRKVAMDTICEVEKVRLEIEKQRCSHEREIHLARMAREEELHRIKVAQNEELHSIRKKILQARLDCMLPSEENDLEYSSLSNNI